MQLASSAHTLGQEMLSIFSGLSYKGKFKVKESKCHLRIPEKIYRRPFLCTGMKTQDAVITSLDI